MLGETMMDVNSQNIIACLETSTAASNNCTTNDAPNGNCQWKSMSGGNGSPGQWCGLVFWTVLDTDSHCQITEQVNCEEQPIMTTTSCNSSIPPFPSNNCLYTSILAPQYRGPTPTPTCPSGYVPYQLSSSSSEYMSCIVPNGDGGLGAHVYSYRSYGYTCINNNQ
jgi:hypothetical protein